LQNIENIELKLRDDRNIEEHPIYSVDDQCQMGWKGTFCVTRKKENSSRTVCITYGGSDKQMFLNPHSYYMTSLLPSLFVKCTEVCQNILKNFLFPLCLVLRSKGLQEEMGLLLTRIIYNEASEPLPRNTGIGNYDFFLTSLSTKYDHRIARDVLSNLDFDENSTLPPVSNRLLRSLLFYFKKMGKDILDKYTDTAVLMTFCNSQVKKYLEPFIIFRKPWLRMFDCLTSNCYTHFGKTKELCTFYLKRSKKEEHLRSVYGEDAKAEDFQLKIFSPIDDQIENLISISHAFLSIPDDFQDMRAYHFLKEIFKGIREYRLQYREARASLITKLLKFSKNKINEHGSMKYLLAGKHRFVQFNQCLVGHRYRLEWILYFVDALFLAMPMLHNIFQALKNSKSENKIESLADILAIYDFFDINQDSIIEKREDFYLIQEEINDKLEALKFDLKSPKEVNASTTTYDDGMIQICTNESRKRQRDIGETTGLENYIQTHSNGFDSSPFITNMIESTIKSEEEIIQNSSAWQSIPRRLIKMKNTQANNGAETDWILIPNFHASHFLRLEEEEVSEDHICAGDYFPFIAYDRNSDTEESVKLFYKKDIVKRNANEDYTPSLLLEDGKVPVYPFQNAASDHVVLFHLWIYRIPLKEDKRMQWYLTRTPAGNFPLCEGEKDYYNLIPIEKRKLNSLWSAFNETGTRKENAIEICGEERDITYNGSKENLSNLSKKKAAYFNNFDCLCSWNPQYPNSGPKGRIFARKYIRSFTPFHDFVRNCFHDLQLDKKLTRSIENGNCNIETAMLKQIISAHLKYFSTSSWTEEIEKIVSEGSSDDSISRSHKKLKVDEVHRSETTTRRDEIRNDEPCIIEVNTAKPQILELSDDDDNNENLETATLDRLLFDNSESNNQRNEESMNQIANRLHGETTPLGSHESKGDDEDTQYLDGDSVSDDSDPTYNPYDLEEEEENESEEQGSESESSSHASTN